MLLMSSNPLFQHCYYSYYLSMYVPLLCVATVLAWQGVDLQKEQSFLINVLCTRCVHFWQEMILQNNDGIRWVSYYSRGSSVGLLCHDSMPTPSYIPCLLHIPLATSLPSTYPIVGVDIWWWNVSKFTAFKTPSYYLYSFYNIVNCQWSFLIYFNHLGIGKKWV